MSRSIQDALPPEDTQQHRLLMAMLGGALITPISAIVEWNVLIPAARCAELRKLGWPVRTTKVPHPNQTKWPNEDLTAYFLDMHFRRWMTENQNAHPADYPFDEGRGKFAQGDK